VRCTHEGIELGVHVQPRAAQSRVGGQHADALRVRVQAPPTEGRANDAVQEALAQALAVRRKDVQLLSGRKGRHKRFRILGNSADLEAAVRRLAAAD